MFKSCWKKIIITLLLIFTIHVSITSSVAANSIQRTLPDTTEDIHLYLVDWTSQIPPIEIIGEIDLLTHLMPDPEIPEDQPNTVELVHQMNPDLPILQYKCLVCEPNGPFCHRIPWGSDPDITRISEWQDANKHEGMFFHSTNPASLTIIPGDGNVNLYWSKDKRGIIPDLNFEVIGYNIYRRTESGSFQKVNTQVITSTSFTDIGLENGERYFYLVKSVNQGGRDYYFSDLVDVRPTASFPTQLLYHQDFEVGFTRTGDSFHQIPVGCQGDFTFKVSALGSPRSVKLYFDYNSDKNFEDTEDGQEIYEMNFQDGNYKIDIINLEIDLNKWNGFAYYFEAQYGADTIKFPSKNAFTTNINNRLRSRLWGNYFPDPGSQVWRDFYVKWAKNWSDQYGYDGVFVDVAGWRGRNFINNHVETYPRDFVNLEQFEEEFDNNQKGMLAYIKNNLDPMLVMFNGFDHLSIEGDRYNLGDYLELVDGGMIEGFAHGGGFDHPPRHFYQTEAKWRDQLNQMINGNLAHNKVVLVLSKGFEDDDVQARVYSLTSYLLGKGDKSYFSTDTKRIFSRFPEQQISIDRPTQSFNSVDKYYLADKNVYKREFTNGLVFVNPSATVTSGTINLPRTYYKAEVTGGTVDEGGTIEYVPVNSIILSPHIGVILLSELPGTTTTSTTTTTTTTVSVTTTTSTTTTIPSCSLDSAYIICNCGSDNECSSGESISVYGSISGSCPIITHLQIDASNYDGACDMQYIRGDISGIYGDYPSLSGYALTDTWIIPTIPQDCEGEIVTASYGAIYKGGSPVSGIWIDNVLAAGECKFFKPSATTTTIPTTTTTSTTTTSTSTTTTIEIEYPIETLDTQILDSNHNPVSSIQSGQQYYIRTTIENTGAETKNPILVIQIKNSKGEVVGYVSSLKSNIAPGRINYLEVGYVAVDPDDYTAEVFVWSNWPVLGGEPLASSSRKTFVVIG